MSKRIISMLLTVALLFGMLPVAATAENADPATEVDTGDVSIEGTNGFGTLLSEDIAEAQAAEEEAYEAGYTVTDLVIEGNTAVVTYDTMEEATLVVAVYTEDGMQMLNSGKATVYPDATQATVTIEGEMPEYFMAEAFLLDTYDFSPLCASYSTPMYTREMQELLVSTVEDYDADRVLNLDDDNTTNFAVYAEDTVVIEPQAGVNTVASVDDENATYVIENADESIASLSEGDVFAYPYDENEILIVKVSSISVIGTTATITGSDDLEMEEVFSHVKIEGELGTEGVEVDDSTAGEGVTYKGKTTAGSESATFQRTASARVAGDDDISNETTIGFDYEIVEKGVFSFKGELDVKTKVSFDYYIAWSYQRVDFSLDFGAEIGLEVEVSKEKDLEVEICTLRFPVLPGVSVTFTPSLVAELSVTLEGHLEFKTTLGFGFEHSDQGVKFLNLCTEPEVTFDAELEGKLFIGFKLTPAIKVLEGVLVDAEISGQLGIEFSGKILDASTGDSIDTMHECTGCIDGKVAFKLKLTPSIQLLKSKKLKFSTELVNFTRDLFDFYLCIQHLDGGIGDCPRILHKLTVEVKNGEGVLHPGITVTTDGESMQTNENGVAQFWLPLAYYNVEAANADGTIVGTTDVFVEEPCKVTIIVTEKSEGESGSSDSGIHFDGILGEVDSEDITDRGATVESSSCGEDVTWSLYSNGLLKISGTGPMADYSDSSSNCAPWYSNRADITSVMIAYGVTNIGDNAFRDCYSLTSATIPDSVNTIGDNAFRDCYSLTSVTIPYNVTSIGDSAFYRCSSLTSVAIPDSVTIIGESAFGSCDSLSNATIGNQVTVIGDFAFWDCSSLTSITIPNSVTFIGNNAFRRCDSLTSVTIPGSVTTIGAHPFYGCQKLTGIYVDLNNSRYSSDGLGVLYNKEKSVLIEAPGAISGHFTIPESVTSISNGAFACCANLISITIPDSVTAIGDYTFRECHSLVSVTIPGSVTAIGDFAFYACRSLADVYYSDTKYAWNAVSVGSDNEELTYATIHYNSAGAARTAVAEVSADEAVSITVSRDAVTYNAAFGGEYSTEETDTYTVKTAYFSDLVSGEEYVLLAMVSIDAEDVLSADNLLYIDQATALADGTLEFRYVQRTPAEISYVVACGASNKDLSDAKITFPAMQAKDEVQVVDPTVVYDGKTLTEGKDYIIVGTVDYTKAGEYTCAIRGIHNYTGLVECTYYVVDKVFADVVPGTYYETPVLWAVEKGITNGISNTLFGTNNNCSRAQVVTFLWRACGSPEPESTTCAFTDVVEGSFYYKAVLWAVEKGITNGISGTEFGTNNNCSRAQVVTFLWRAVERPGYTNAGNPFTDVAEGAFYYDAVLWAVEKGVTNGVSDTLFGTNTNCSRAQVVTFLYRTLV